MSTRSSVALVVLLACSDASTPAAPSATAGVGPSGGRRGDVIGTVNVSTGGNAHAGSSAGTPASSAAADAGHSGHSGQDANTPALAGAGTQAGAPSSAGAAATAGTAGTPAADGGGPEACEPVPSGEHLAFPGAEGFGRLARGGRGGDVCHVTQLGDDGAGSLRACVSQGDRTVVFDAAGWITLKSNLGITVNNLTIAGQTAPGGVGIRGAKVSIGGHDIVLRFLRVRRGTITTSDRNDAMAVSASARSVIIDHCSVGFGTDENLSMPGDEGTGPRDLTLQWSIVAWGLQRNNHSAGSLLTASNTTIHHTLYAFNSTRNPKARSEAGRPLDFVNNVVYGWNAPDPIGEAEGWNISQQPFLLADSSNGQHNANAVGNYFIAHGTRAADKAFVAGAQDGNGEPTFRLFFDGNLLDGNANGQLDVSRDDWDMVATAARLPARIAAPQVCSDDAAHAYAKVLAHAGATVPVRDEVDAKLAELIAAQAGDKLHDPSDLGVGAEGYGELVARTPEPDTDADGMPDAWEQTHALDPQQPEDRNADPDGDGYTALEAYLNALAAPAFRY
ncbi:MAG: pectate lyase [Polyangiales bacterium]